MQTSILFLFEINSSVSAVVPLCTVEEQSTNTWLTFDTESAK